MIARLPKLWVWAALSTPELIIVARYAMDSISYGQVIHQSGLWSAGLLAVALLASPLRSVWPSSTWVRTLLRHRRAIGVASFACAALHTLAYIEYKETWARIVEEGCHPDLLTGWAALAIFAILAITSNDWSVRQLRRNWKRLHRGVHVAAVLLFAHWYLSAFDARPALVLALVVLAAQTVRVWRRRRGI